MSIRTLYLLLGYLSVLLGAISVMGMSRIKWLYMSSGIGALAMVLGLVNIFMSVRYFSEEEKTPKGYFGLFLGALPIVFLMLVLFKFGKH